MSVINFYEIKSDFDWIARQTPWFLNKYINYYISNLLLRSFGVLCKKFKIFIWNGDAFDKTLSLFSQIKIIIFLKFHVLFLSNKSFN